MFLLNESTADQDTSPMRTTRSMDLLKQLAVEGTRCSLHSMPRLDVLIDERALAVIIFNYGPPNQYNNCS